MRKLAQVVDDPTSVSTTALSFEEFFEREKQSLFGALCLVTRDRYEAEELAQEAFVRLLERWQTVANVDDPRAYLYRTAMNVFRSRYRRAVLASRRTLGISKQDDLIAQVDDRDEVVRAMADLSRQQRAALVLTELLDFTSEDAARILGVRPSTLRTHASRGRAALKGTRGDD